MLSLIRTNPGLLIGIILIAMSTLVLSGIGFWMSRGGASVKPIWWMGGFFALILVPQFVGHLVVALRAKRQEAPRAAALARLQQASETQSPSADARATAATSWIGPDADPALVRDARPLFGDVFARAEEAQFAVLPSGESVLLARFSGALSAEKAWVGYLQSTGLALLPGKGDSQRGWVVTRPTGDRVYAVHLSRCVGVWTGPDDLTIRRRMHAGGFEIPSRAPLAGKDEFEAALPANDRPKSVALAWKLLGGVALAAYLLFVVAYFCRGSAWAGGESPVAGVAPRPVETVARAIESVGTRADVPYRVERGTRPNEWFVTWDFANAKWVDFARARGLKRTHRLRLVLDEAKHTVRVTDFAAEFDWSAGSGGAALSWKASSGVIFFKRETQHVVGLQIGDGVEASPKLHYSYSFDLQSMKAPFIAAVTEAGWSWRPVVWDAPAALRWLTE